MECYMILNEDMDQIGLHSLYLENKSRIYRVFLLKKNQICPILLNNSAKI